MITDEWVARFASELAVEPPTEAEKSDLLALAGIAAHASERMAAPLSCWLVGRAGISIADALKTARRIELPSA
jgi:hypothetical protein